MEAAIRLENVSFGYHGVQVLRQIDFSVKKGEHVGIVGRSGCGKSTLLKLISGLYLVWQGKIMVDGKTEPKEIRNRVSVVMQNPGLFPATIRENISCGHEMSEDRIRAACEAARLTEWLKAVPAGLDTFVGERGLGVSGGQAQRIAIARAIARDAPIFLLDEATSALDGDTSGDLISNLEDIADAVSARCLRIGKHNVFFYSHAAYKLESCSSCDAVYIASRMDESTVCCA